MKKVISLISILVATSIAQSRPIEDKKLISWVNYGMEALEVVNLPNDQVQLIVGGAILHYADNRPMLDAELDKVIVEKLGMKGHVLVITFKKSDCMQHSKVDDLVMCSTLDYPNKRSSAKIQSALVNNENHIIKLSPKSIEDEVVSIETHLITELSATNRKYSTIKANVQISSLILNNLKSGLGKQN